MCRAENRFEQVVHELLQCALEMKKSAIVNKIFFLKPELASKVSFEPLLKMYKYHTSSLPCFNKRNFFEIWKTSSRTLSEQTKNLKIFFKQALKPLETFESSPKEARTLLQGMLQTWV
jgi:hypothetical protein